MEDERTIGSSAERALGQDGVDNQQQQREPASSTDESYRTALASAEGARSDASSGGGSQRSVASPTLDPAQHNAMTSSIISTLDLGEERTSPSVIPTLSTHAEDASEHIDATPHLAHSAEPGSSFSHVSGASSSLSNGTAGPTPAKPATPVAPHDLLPPVHEEAVTSLGSSYGTLSASFSNPDVLTSTQHLGQMSSTSGDADVSAYSFGGPATGDDSALNALMEAHGSEHHAHRPSKRDASFGLDPDVDTLHAVQGQPFRPLLPRALSTSSQKHHHHHHHGHHQATPTGESGNVYDLPEASAPSHTTAATGAPATMNTGDPHTQTVPTVSATGAPRIFGRRTSRSASVSSASFSSPSDAPAPREMQPSYAPSGSLTLALFASGIGWRRRSYLLLASLAINIGLPFVNGVMLGFGEIFARSIVAPWLGLIPAATMNISAPAGRRERASASHEPPPPKRSGNTSGVGLRHAR